MQRFDDGGRLRGRAEAQAARRADRDGDGQGHEDAVELSGAHGYADRVARRGGGRSARRRREGAQRRPDDGTRDGRPVVARHEGLFGHYGARRRRGAARRGERLHQMRQMRAGLPDGAGTLSALETLAQTVVGASRRRGGHLVHRMRMLPVHLSGRCWTTSGWASSGSWG